MPQWEWWLVNRFILLTLKFPSLWTHFTRGNFSPWLKPWAIEDPRKFEYTSTWRFQVKTCIQNMYKNTKFQLMSQSTKNLKKFKTLNPMQVNRVYKNQSNLKSNDMPSIVQKLEPITQQNHAHTQSKLNYFPTPHVSIKSKNREMPTLTNPSRPYGQHSAWYI